MSIKDVLKKIEKELTEHAQKKSTTELGFVVHLKCGGVCYAVKTSKGSLTD